MPVRGRPLPGDLLDEAMRFARLRAAIDPELTPGWLAARAALLSWRSRSLRAVLDRGDVDRLVLWNGWHPEARAAHLWAERRGIPCLHLENGLLPGRMQADFAGVNAAASFASLPLDRWPPAPDGVREVAISSGHPGPAWHPVEEVRPGPAAAWVHRVTSRPLGFGRLRRGLAGSAPPPPHALGSPDGRPYALLALQVPDDTQVLLWSARELWDASSLVAPVRRAVRAAFGPDLRLAVKPHPLDPSWRSVATAVDRTPDCLLAGGDVGPWLDAAAAVVVLNSSVGLEAVLRGRPVVTLADSMYDVDGVVTRARGLGDLAAALGRAVTGERCERNTHALIGMLAVHAGMPGERTRLAPDSVDALASLLTAGTHPWSEARDG